jgi:hypothetical protein
MAQFWDKNDIMGGRREINQRGTSAFMWVISDDDMLDTKFMTVMIGFILVFLYSNPIIRFLISDNTIFLFGLG